MNPRAATATPFQNNNRTMKRHTMLITTTTLALFTWPLRAQDNPPDRPQNPPQNIEGPRNSDARSRDREPEPRDAQFQRGDNPMRRPDGTGGRGPRTAHPQDFRRDRPNDPQDISRDDARPNAGQTDPPRDPDA